MVHKNHTEAQLAVQDLTRGYHFRNLVVNLMINQALLLAVPLELSEQMPGRCSVEITNASDIVNG